MSFQIILGSASAARRQILAEMGYGFTVMADAILSRLLSEGQLDRDAPATLLITADKDVVYEGIVREKPSSKEDAWNFIKGLFSRHTRGGGRQPEEGITLNVAGGLMLEHPLISPFVEAACASFGLLQIGTTDTVMGLPKQLTEKLVQEAV